MHEAYGRYLNAQDEARGLSTTTRFLLFEASYERTADATKGQELLGHFRVKETMYIRPANRYSRDAMHPDKFQFGTTQILPEKEALVSWTPSSGSPVMSTPPSIWPERLELFAQVRMLYDLWTLAHGCNDCPQGLPREAVVVETVIDAVVIAHLKEQNC